MRAKPLFYWDFEKQIIHENHDGHHTANNAFRLTFENSGYNFILVDPSPAVDWEGFGKGATRMEMFKRLLDRYNYEFEIQGKTIIMRHMIGNDTNYMYKYKLNASNVSENIDASGMFTHIKGFGNFEDGEEDYYNNAKLKRQYTSPLADIVTRPGKQPDEGPPIRDGRIKDPDVMDRAMKQAVDDSLQITVEGTLHDVRKMGYTAAVPRKGDRVWLHDERLDLEREIRLHTVETTKDEKDNIIACDVTFGSQSIRERHKAAINTLSQNFADLLTGKLKLPIISLEQIGMDMIKAIHAASSEIIFGDFGMLAISKIDPNRVMGLNSEGWYISEDGGRTPRTIATAEGIYADALFAGTLWLTNDMNIVSADGYLNVTGSRFTMRSKTHPNNAVEITPDGITIRGFDGRELIINGIMKSEHMANIQLFNDSFNGVNMFQTDGEYSSMYVIRDKFRGRFLDISGVTRLVGTYSTDQCQLDIQITLVGGNETELFRQRETITGSAEPVDYSYRFSLDLQELYEVVPDYRNFQFYVRTKLVNFEERHDASFRINRGMFNDN